MLTFNYTGIKPGKFKEGEYVLHKLNASGTIFRVREIVTNVHEAFTSNYMYLDGCKELVNQDDYIAVDSFHEYAKYVAEALIVYMAGLISGVLIYHHIIAYALK